MNESLYIETWVIQLFYELTEQICNEGRSYDCFELAEIAQTILNNNKNKEANDNTVKLFNSLLKIIIQLSNIIANQEKEELVDNRIQQLDTMLEKYFNVINTTNIMKTSHEGNNNPNSHNVSDEEIKVVFNMINFDGSCRAKCTYMSKLLEQIYNKQYSWRSVYNRCKLLHLDI